MPQAIAELEVIARRVDAGFSAENVLTMRVSLPDRRYPEPARVRAYYHEAMRRLKALPGVQAAGAIDSLPLLGGSVQPVVLEGRAELLPRDQPTAEVRKILPGYLPSMRIPVQRGRDIADNDQDVVLVSRGAAKLLWVMKTRSAAASRCPCSRGCSTRPSSASAPR